MRTVGRWWYKIPGQVLIGVANVMIAAATASVAALLGLVADNLLPATGPAHLVWSRFWWLIVALAALILAIVARGSVHAQTGTLFYVRILDDAMRDLHTQALTSARRRRMSLRSVTRWVDLDGSTTDTGVIDIVDECAAVGSALQAVVNSDRDDTAYTIAPNLLWPAALAVGAELPIVRRLEVLEFATLDQRSKSRSPETRFILPDDNTDKAPTTDVVVDTVTVPGQPRRSGRVGLFLAFSKSALNIDAATEFAARGVGGYHRIRPASVSADLSELTTDRYHAGQLASLAAALPAAVATIKKRAGNRELVVIAAMPKTLALALGWGLAQRDCRFFHRTHLLNWTSGTAFVPMRVHPAQPTSAPASPPVAPPNSPLGFDDS